MAILELYPFLLDRLVDPHIFCKKVVFDHFSRY